MNPSARKSTKGEAIRELFDFVFGFENKKGEILDHWIAFHDRLSFSPEEFYDTVERELKARKVPGMTISREEFGEGGLISDKRIYLRLFRERLALYACASPFGTGYFFSCRTVYVPALVRLWHILAAITFFGIVCLLLVRPLGISFAAIAAVTLVFALAETLRRLSSSAVPDLDTLILKIPVVSTIYEAWFRAQSYYRIDTRAIYVQRIPALIKEIAEEITAAKGAKLVQQYRFAPVFGDLYKPLSPSQKPDAS